MRSRTTWFLILIVGASIPLWAGGARESVPESDTAADAPRSEGLSAAEREEIQEILTGFGVQTFRGQINAVDFSLETLDGGSLALSDLRGEFVFLNFWATWCPPCREEMPSMEELQATIGDAPFRMIAVNVREDRGTVAGFIDEFGYTYPILLDTDGRISNNYGVRGIPTTFFIGPDGSVLGMLVGTRYWDEVAVVDGMKRIVEIVSAQ